MNKVVLVGNLTRDPEKRTTQSGRTVTRFTVAVNRPYRSQDGTQQTDFISCVAWEKTGEFIANYFAKGSRIGLAGSIRTRTYDDPNGIRKYVTEVNVEEAEFVTSKSENPGANQPRESAPVQEKSAPPQSSGSLDPDELFKDDLQEYEPLGDSELPF